MLRCQPELVAGTQKGMEAMGTAVASSPCRGTSLQLRASAGRAAE